MFSSHAGITSDSMSKDGAGGFYCVKAPSEVQGGLGYSAEDQTEFNIGPEYRFRSRSFLRHAFGAYSMIYSQTLLSLFYGSETRFL